MGQDRFNQRQVLTPDPGAPRGYRIKQIIQVLSLTQEH